MREMADRLCEPVRTVANPGEWPEAEFQRFFLEHYSRVARILLRIVGERARAEELASDVFWKLYRGRMTAPDGNFAGWLYRTATNAGIDALRADGRRRRYEQAAGEAMAESQTAGDPLDDALKKEEQAQVRAVLASLKPAQAQALVLRASGFSYKELAETLGIKPASVGTTLLRAEAAFRERYLESRGKNAKAESPQRPQQGHEGRKEDR